MRIVFLGTSEFAVASLEAVLDSSHEVALVVTQPDRPAGRGRKTRPTPVRAAALEHGLEIVSLETTRTRAAREIVRAASPDVGVVVSFGQVLGPRFLAVPPLGFLNVHASLLPRHRGASPINAMILSGDAEVGVSVMRLTEGLDEGPVGVRRAAPALPRETAGELHDRLAPMGGEALVETLDGLEAGTIEFVEQDHARATFAGLMTKADGALDFSLPAIEVDRRVRGLHPWPGSWAELHADEGSRRVVVERAEPREESSDAPPGEIVAVSPEALTVACGEGVLDIVRVKPSGSRAMNVRDFLNGTAVVPGDRFARAGS